MYVDTIKKIARLLLPRGRAFDYPKDGVIDKINGSLAESESRAVADGSSILDSILPDNDDFSVEDAEDWEVRLGMITNPTVSLADRKAAILRKMQHPGTIKPRQHWRYIQKSLQEAGFDLYVHENLPGNSPIDYYISGSTTYSLSEFGLLEFGEEEFGGALSAAIAAMLDPVQFGQVQFGQSQFAYRWNGDFIIANHIDPALDANFDVGGSYRCSFFIGGQNFGDFGEVEAARIPEYRELVLKLKPANTVAFSFVNEI
jgi:hypothetical protein